MRLNHISDFIGKYVNINTSIETETSQGVGLMSYSGILVDVDDDALYLGPNDSEITHFIMWSSVVSGEIVNEAQEDLSGFFNMPPATGANN